MNHGDRDKNPFFLPAFLTMLSPVLLIGAATIAVGYMAGYVDGLILELIHLMMIIAAPVATLVLSVAGIVTAIKTEKTHRRVCFRACRKSQA